MDFRKICDEHRATLDWLNSVTDESVQFFGVEIEIYRIGNSIPAPRFNVVSMPNNWSKSVRRVAQSAAQLTETKILQQEYWKALKDYVETQTVSFKMQKPQPQHWTNIAIGKTNYKICAIANTRDKSLAVQLVISGEIQDSLQRFNRLRELYEDASKISLGNGVEWVEKKDGKEHHVNYVMQNKNPLDKQEWDNQHQLLCRKINEFYIFFIDKIKNI
jgi:hypothetical protein